MSNIKRTVERENLSAVFFCEFFHSKIVYMEEKIREGCGSDQGKSQNAVRSRSHIFGCMYIGRRRCESRNFEMDDCSGTGGIRYANLYRQSKFQILCGSNLQSNIIGKPKCIINLSGDSSKLNIHLFFEFCCAGFDDITGKYHS